ncbi:hypothetical protein UPYG_G00231360 [Umbra pygmaea]|uniref:Uncharacterized protein n=1 Tax=Umbra pygmaea TaxID=75934 RepID=A0ABD0WVS0_UMBPY
MPSPWSCVKVTPVTLRSRTDEAHSFSKRVQIMDRAAAEVMEQFPFLGVPQLMLHEMTMRFGTDLAKNMEISLNEMAPNIIRSAKEGRQRKLYANLIGSAEENTEGRVRNAAPHFIASII